MTDRTWFVVRQQGSLLPTEFASEAEARNWVDSSGVRGCSHFEVIRLTAPTPRPGSPSTPTETVVASRYTHAERCHHYPLDPQAAAADGAWRSHTR